MRHNARVADNPGPARHGPWLNSAGHADEGWGDGQQPERLQGWHLCIRRLIGQNQMFQTLLWLKKSQFPCASHPVLFSWEKKKSKEKYVDWFPRFALFLFPGSENFLFHSYSYKPAINSAFEMWASETNSHECCITMFGFAFLLNSPSGFC